MVMSFMTFVTISAITRQVASRLCEMLTKEGNCNSTTMITIRMERERRAIQSVEGLSAE